MVIIVVDSHFKEHLHLEGCEAEAFLDSWVPLEERSSGDPPTDPLNWNHLTLGRDERRVGVLLQKGRFYACQSQDIAISPLHKSPRNIEQRVFWNLPD